MLMTDDLREQFEKNGPLAVADLYNTEENDGRWKDTARDFAKMIHHLLGENSSVRDLHSLKRSAELLLHVWHSEGRLDHATLETAADFAETGLSQDTISEIVEQ